MLDQSKKGIIAMGTPEELRRTSDDPMVRRFLFRENGGKAE
jgi:hypothetical protein